MDFYSTIVSFNYFGHWGWIPSGACTDPEAALIYAHQVQSEIIDFFGKEALIDLICDVISEEDVQAYQELMDEMTPEVGEIMNIDHQNGCYLRRFDLISCTFFTNPTKMLTFSSEDWMKRLRD